MAFRAGAGGQEASAQQPLLQIKDLSIGYRDPQHRPVRLIQHVDLTVRHREVVGLVGESGSGKTQTARAILKLNTPPLHPMAGEILVDGEDVLQVPPKKLRAIRGGKVAMIFQDPRASLNPLMRVGDQLARLYKLHAGISRRQAHLEALEMLRRVGIAGPERVAKSYPHQLSGGMCQRIMIALCLGMSPDLLIADEPTTGLDVTIQAQILELLQTIQSDIGTSVLLITHDLGVVAEICHRVAVMYAGRVVEVADVGDIFGEPMHPYTRHLLQATLALEAQKDVPESQEPPPDLDFAVGSRVYRATLASALEPDSQATMVEVSPGHLVLCMPMKQQDRIVSDTSPDRTGATP